jgi:probable HAF family extracellular repeat protein
MDARYRHHRLALALCMVGCCIQWPALLAQTVQEMVDRGVSQLLKMQEPEVDSQDHPVGDPNHWEYEYITGTSRPVGTTAICAEALLLAPGYAEDQARQEAVERATLYLLNGTLGCGGKGDEVFLLRFLLRLEKLGKVPCAAVDPPDRLGVKDKILALIDVLGCVSTRSLPSPENSAPGYPYSGGDNSYSIFFQAPALLALADARDLGYAVDTTVVHSGLDSLLKSRVCAGKNAGAYLYQGTTSTLGGTPNLLANCADPPETTDTAVENSWSCWIATIPGSISRMAAAETSLFRWGIPPDPQICGGPANPANLHSAIGMFFDDKPYRPSSAYPSLTAYDWLHSQKGRGAHAPPYNIAEYFFMYALYHNAVAVEALWNGVGASGCPECPGWRTTLVDRLQENREADGTWSERCISGSTDPTCFSDPSDPHCSDDPDCVAARRKKTYPTAMALLTLLAPSYLSVTDPGGVQVQGRVNNDLNGNGITGLTVCLKSEDQGGHLHSTTDATGLYSFSQVPAGTYTLAVEPPPGWIQTYPPATNRVGVRRGTWNASQSLTADVWGAELGGRYYAFLGHEDPSADILDVTSPCEPKLIQHLSFTSPSPTICGHVEDVVVRGSTGFFAADGDCGVVVMDLRGLPAPAAQEIARINAARFPTYVIKSHTVEVDGNLLFVGEMATGQHRVPVFDVANPSNPVPLGPVVTQTLGRVHDVCAKNGLLYACIIEDSDLGGVKVFDISQIRCGSYSFRSKISGLPGAHSCSLTEDGRYLVVAQERAVSGCPDYDPSCQRQVRIYDVGNPASPYFVTIINNSPDAFSPHNPYVLGNLLYMSWYQAGAIVFDLTNPAAPCRASYGGFFDPLFPANPCSSGTFPIGYYDTYCGTQSTGYHGDWGIYPGLGPDRILVSDKESGLLVLSSAGSSYRLTIGSQPVSGQDFRFVATPDCNRNGIPDLSELSRTVTLLSAEFQDTSFPPSGWSQSGLGLWHRSITCSPGAGDCAPGAWAYYGQDSTCNFNVGTTSGSLTSPSVLIPASASSVTLRYCSSYAGEGGISKSSGKDWAWVEINGSKIDDVSQAGTQLSWRTRTVDLTSYAGSKITLKWSFNSVDGNNNNYAGWRVAQVVLSAQFNLDTNQNSIPDECDTGYRIVDLGTLGGLTSAAYDINDWGEVVGNAQGPLQSHGFFWRDTNSNGWNDAGEMLDLGTLGGSNSVARAINSGGRVAGYAQPGSLSPQHAFFWEDTNCNGLPDSGELVDLQTLGGSISYGYAINAAGVIVGWSYDSSSKSHAFLWDGTMSQLDALTGVVSEADAVNGGGKVTGSYQSGSVTLPFLWTPGSGGQQGQLVSLGSLGGSWGSGYAINELGQVAGASNNSSGSNQAFFYDGSMHPLGDLGGGTSIAYGLNEAGDVVGTTTKAGSISVAFLKRGCSATMEDLNAYLPPGSVWVLTQARAINHSGQIVGTGKARGYTRAFLLTPVAR